MYVCTYVSVCLSIYFSLPLVWRDGLGICWVNVVFSFASMGTEALKACSWRPLTSRSKWSRVSCFLDQCRLILAFLRLGCPLELGRRVHVMKALKSVPADLGGDGKISKGGEIVVNKLGCGLVPPDFELLIQYNPLMHLIPLGHVEK